MHAYWNALQSSNSSTSSILNINWNEKSWVTDFSHLFPPSDILFIGPAKRGRKRFEKRKPRGKKKIELLFVSLDGGRARPVRVKREHRIRIRQTVICDLPTPCLPYAPSPWQSFASQPECVSHVVNFYVHTSTGALWLYLSVQKVDPIFSHYLFCFSEFGDKGYSIEKAL